jgi:hypothetical protein
MSHRAAHDTVWVQEERPELVAELGWAGVWVTPRHTSTTAVLLAGAFLGWGAPRRRARLIRGRSNPTYACVTRVFFTRGTILAPSAGRPWRVRKVRLHLKRPARVTRLNYT